MKVNYCSQKNCTYRLCKHHFTHAKLLVKGKVVAAEDLVISNMETCDGCRTNKTKELNRQRNRFRKNVYTN